MTSIHDNASEAKMSQEYPELRSGSDVGSDKEKAVPEAQGAAASDFPEGGFRAWSVAIATSAVLFCTLGYVNSWGVYQSYYQTHQLSDKSPSAIAWIGSLQSFFIFAGSLIGGPLFDRYGAKIIRPAAVTYVLAIMLTSLCKEYWQFMLAQGVLGGIANGMTMSPSMAATPQYFNKKRGAAIGIAIAGSSLGGVVLPIILSKMLDSSLGFGWSVRVIGFIMLAVLILPAVAIRARLPPRQSSFFLPSAFRDVTYLAVIAASFCLFLGMMTPLFYLPTYATQHGMSTALASYLVAIFNGASLPGRVLPGVLADRLGRFNMLAFAGISSGVLTLCWTQCESNAAIIVFACIFGFCSGAIISGVTVSLASCPSDPQNIGTYMGQGMAIAALATLVGPPVNGALLSQYKSFDRVAVFSGVICLAGGFVVLVAKYTTGKGMLALV